MRRRIIRTGKPGYQPAEVSAHYRSLRQWPRLDFIQPAFAVDRTWFGGTGNFGEATNWTPSGVPGSGDRAIINSGSSTLSFNTGISGLDFLGGILSGNGNLAVSGLSTWTAGTITGAATTNFESGLELSGNAAKTISGSRVVNADDTTWSGNTGDFGNNFIITNSTFNNTGTFTDTNAFANQMGGTGGIFNNSGAYNKQTDTLTHVGSGVALNNMEILNVQTGVLNLAHAFANAGTVNVGATGTLQSSCGGTDCFSNTGIMQGNGIIQTPANNELVNSGAINPGNGIGHLTLNGDLNQTSGGVVNFELASLSSFDRLTVTDDVTLDGDIAVWNLGYTPVIGDSFVVATFDDRLDNSTFSSITTHGFGSAVDFRVDYNEHNVMLTVVPEPEQYAMLLAGLGLMGAMTRRRRT